MLGPIIIISLPRSGSSMTTGLFANHGAWVGPYKKTEDVVRGDYSSLERAFNHCGIKFNPAIADGFVDPELWRF